MEERPLYHYIPDVLKSHELLRQQEELLRLLVETLEEIFWIFDLKLDKLLYVSPKYEQVYGSPIQNVYTYPGSFLKIVHPEDIPSVKKAYKQIEKGKGFDIEYRINNPDGTLRWIWSRSFIIKDTKNKSSLVIGTASDITERKKVQLDKNLLAAIVENTEDLAVIKDRNLRIIASNKANTLAAGKMNAEELIGKTDIELYGDLPHVRQYVEDDHKAMALKKGETLVNEQVHIYPDGQVMNTLVKKFPVFDEKNRLIAVASIARDITNYKKAEATLLKSEQELREMNCEKDKFFSIIAHDLKNPFHSILNFSDLLLKHYSSYDKEEVLTFIKMIHESSTQAFNLLDNLLHWSRAHSGRMNLKPEVVDVQDIVLKNIYLLEGMAMEKNIRLIPQVKSNTNVVCDENMISTVIRNLLSNAIKFTRPTGKVTIKTSEKSTTYEIAVTDTGVGISEEDQGKLFRIDVHFSTTGTANEEGTGLGLVLCREFVNLNNGSIRVVSQPGKGSTFFVELPKARS